MIHITETVALDEHEIQERFVRAMGPRSQNLNRDATAVELRLDVARSSLPRDVKKRLIRARRPTRDERWSVGRRRSS
jgi:ribosome-associated protein